MEHPTLQDISLNDRPYSDVKVTSDKFHIGSSLSNSLVINRSILSRKHCTIECNKGEWFIIDKSSNGTRVNGDFLVKQTKHKLKPGDIISLSDISIYIFKLPERKSSTITKPISEDEILDAAASVIENADRFNEDCISLSSTESSGPSVECFESAKSTIVNNSSLSTVSACKREHSSDNADESELKKMKLQQDIHNELHCIVCTEMFVKAQTLSCSHTFCKYCIKKWRKYRNVCPICRRQITTLSPTSVLNNIIQKIIANSSKEIQDQRRAVIEERNAVPSTSYINTASNTATRSNTSNVISDDENEETLSDSSDHGYVDDEDQDSESGAGGDSIRDSNEDLNQSI